MAQLMQAFKQGAALIPMSSPDIGQAEFEAVNQVLRDPCLSRGRRLYDFEQEFARFIGRRHASGVSSGTAGLHLCVIASGASKEDLVITSPFSFVASANAILYEGAIPVFIDVDPLTGNIDAARVQEAIEDLSSARGSADGRWLPPAVRDSVGAARLKAVLPVHLFGQPADMDPILETAAKYSVVVIEDACEAVGAEYKSRKAGSLGDMAVFGFYPNKQITTGEGGMIVADRDDWARLFRSLRNQGRHSGAGGPEHSRLGYNYRMDEMSAALGLAQMGRIEELLQKRERVARWYTERLAGQELIETPQIAPATTRMSWFVYPVRLKPPLSRSAVRALLQEKGIPSRPYFSPIHLYPFYERFGYRQGDFPVAEYLSKVSLTLPFSGIMTEEQVDCICDHLLLAARRPSASRRRSCTN